jgi:hypothetical protein
MKLLFQITIKDFVNHRFFLLKTTTNFPYVKYNPKGSWIYYTSQLSSKKSDLLVNSLLCAIFLRLTSLTVINLKKTCSKIGFKCKIGYFVQLSSKIQILSC